MIKLKLNGLIDRTNVLVALETKTYTKSWYYEIDDWGHQTNEMYQQYDLIKSETDMNNIFFDDIIPENNIIELPDVLLHKNILVRARYGGVAPMLSVDTNITLHEDTTLIIIQKLDI